MCRSSFSGEFKNRGSLNIKSSYFDLNIKSSYFNREISSLKDTDLGKKLKKRKTSQSGDTALVAMLKIRKPNYNNQTNLMGPVGRSPILPIVVIYYVTAKLLENYGWDRNVKTFGYSMLHPINAFYIVGDYEKGSKNISTISSNFEINIVKNTTGLIGIKEGTDGNAIRHALWQAIITKDLGIDDAESIGNAHEDESNVNMKQRQFKDIKKADQTIDLLNNIIGRDIGKNHPTGQTHEFF